MKISFTKLEALGNDFVLFDATEQNIELTSDQIKKIANRNTGIGCDQVLLLEPAKNDQADFHYRIFNADGSEVEQCGNGARCVGLYIQEKSLSQKNNLRLQTINNIIEVTTHDNHQFSVNMGQPKFNDKHTYPLLNNIEATIINMGNPHCVLFEKDFSNDLAQQIQSHKDFPNSINVGFANIIDKTKINLRVFERGVGETQACGSGACAAAVAARLRNLIEPEVTVTLPGGDLMISWSDAITPVWMTGPASKVFDGLFQL